MTTRALVLLTRCSDAAEATALRAMLAEGGIESRGASGDGRAVLVAAGELAEARALLSAWQAVNITRDAIAEDDARPERQGELLLPPRELDLDLAQLKGFGSPTGRRRRRAFWRALFPGFGAGHWVARRRGLAALLAVTEGVGIANIALAHKLMGAVLIVVAIGVDLIGSQLALRQ